MAGSASRIMRARMLLCPPAGSSTCLLPALGKYSKTSAILLETPDSKKPSEFFTVDGYRDDRVKIFQVLPWWGPHTLWWSDPAKNPSNKFGWSTDSFNLYQDEWSSRSEWLSVGSEYFHHNSLLLHQQPRCPVVTTQDPSDELDAFINQKGLRRAGVNTEWYFEGTVWRTPFARHELLDSSCRVVFLLLVSQQLGTHESLGFNSRSYSPVCAAQAQERIHCISIATFMPGLPTVSISIITRTIAYLVV